jgi:hypothetical protein
MNEDGGCFIVSALDDLPEVKGFRMEELWFASIAMTNEGEKAMIGFKQTVEQGDRHERESPDHAV